MGYSIPGLIGLETEGPTEEEQDGLIFNVYLVHPTGKPICPNCGSMVRHKHNDRIRQVRDLDNFGVPTILKINYCSYDCQNCGTYYKDDLSDYVDENARMTIRMRDMIAKRCFDYTFADVARDFHVNEKTCRRAYANWLKIKEEERGKYLFAPSVLGIDETHLAGKMCGVFTDNSANTILEITAKRDKDTVIRFLRSLQNPENMSAVTMDMWKAYREAVYEVFGKEMIIVIDHFHVIQELLKQAVYCKNRLQEKAGLPKGAYRDISHPVKLYRSNMEDLSEEEKEELAKYFTLVPGLKQAYALKEGFRAIYSTCKTSYDAMDAFDKWVKSIPEDEDFNAYRSFRNTINNWKREIFNFFDYRYSNAFTECFNGLTKKVMRQGNGYSFEVLRGKMLYGTSATAYKKVVVKKEKPAYSYSYMGDAGFTKYGSSHGYYDLDNFKYKKVTEIHFGADAKILSELFENDEFSLKKLETPTKYQQIRLF